MIGADAYFEDLMMRVIEGQATEEEIATFSGIILMDRELRNSYATEMRVHALLSGVPRVSCPCFMGETPIPQGVLQDPQPKKQNALDPVPAPMPRGSVLKKIAVLAAALAIAATGLWLAMGVHKAQRTPQAVAGLPPVEVLHQQAACGLEVPASLPGTMRLTSGQIKARLASGVELSLIGPFEMDVCDAMQVRLASGGLVADVPPHAAGFTVRTPQLEVWDLGTVFSVSVSEGVSDVFVFQGSVQVNEADGEPVDLCEAGQGVRAAANGWRPHKVAADSVEARTWFGAVAGRQKALRDPAAALAAADRIATQWGERWLPKIVEPPKPVPGLSGWLAVGSGQLAVGNKQSAISNGQLAMGGQQLKDEPKVEGRRASVAGQETITTPVRGSAPETKQEETAMRGITNTVAALAAAVTMGAGAVYAVPQVTNARMNQRAGTRVVDILYDLSGEAAIITLGIETNGVPIPDSAVTRLSGDVSVVIQPGTDRHIVWNAGADWPENVTESAKARVTAWALDTPPLYCAIDVSGGASATSYPVHYYPSAEAVPGGVTNYLYKTLWILMRQIPPTGGEGFMMGSPSTEFARYSNEGWHQVILTNAFYAGVYPITQSQWNQVMSDFMAWPSFFNNSDYRLARPVEQVSYYRIRENTASNADDPAVDWPNNDAVNADSFMGRLRTKTGLAGLDLPTEAQWEYACRAGTTGALNDGTVNLTNSLADARMSALGRYTGNNAGAATQNSDTTRGTDIVGSYAPNAWGLYDMHGNVREWCLDWYGGSLGSAPATDPKGADSGTKRISRGGCYPVSVQDCRSACRLELEPNTAWPVTGFRLFRTLP